MFLYNYHYRASSLNGHYWKGIHLKIYLVYRCVYLCACVCQCVCIHTHMPAYMCLCVWLSCTSVRQCVHACVCLCVLCVCVQACVLYVMENFVIEYFYMFSCAEGLLTQCQGVQSWSTRMHRLISLTSTLAVLSTWSLKWWVGLYHNISYSHTLIPTGCRQCIDDQTHEIWIHSPRHGGGTITLILQLVLLEYCYLF